MNSEKIKILYTLARLTSAPPSHADIPACVENTGAAQWPRIFDAGANHRLLPLIYKNLHNLGLLEKTPATIRNLLAHEARATAAVNVLFLKLHEIIFHAFASGRIPLVPLKGIRHIGNIYAADERPLTDLDYLVRPEHRGDVSRIMAALEFTRKISGVSKAFEEKYAGELHFEKTAGGMPAAVETHFELLPLSALRASFPQLPEVLWKGVVEENGFPVLRPEHELLFSIIHFAVVHCFSRLIWLADADRLLRHYETSWDWDVFLDAVWAVRARTPALCTLRAASRLFNSPVPEAFMQKLEKRAKRFPAETVDAWLAGAAHPADIGLLPYRLAHDTARALLRHVFPPPGFMQSRYGIPPWKTPFFYVLRPISLISNALDARKF